jgi:small nuclear ribonucleoprotein (snRNP)-like protein
MRKERDMLKGRRLFSAFIVLSLVCRVAVAGNNLGDWNNVRILEAGATVVVKTKAGEKYEGNLKSVKSDSLSVVVDVSRVVRQVIEIRRDEVKEVRTKLPRAASAAIGAGLGLGLGVGLGAIADSRDKYGEDPGLGKAVFGSLGLLLGSLAGTAMSFGKKVYEAP